MILKIFYEVNFILDKLLQTAVKRLVRQTQNSLPVEFEMALAAPGLRTFVEFFVDGKNMGKMRNVAAVKKPESKSLEIFQEIEKNHENALADSFENYSNSIWAMARKLTGSPEDAETAVRQMFFEIWRNTAPFDPVDFDELIFTTIIARRRLLERSKKIA